MEKKLILVAAAIIMLSCSKPVPYDSTLRNYYRESLRVEVTLKDVSIHDAMTKEEVRRLFQRKLHGATDTLASFKKYLDNPPAMEFLTVRYQTVDGGEVHVSELTSEIHGTDTVITEVY